jgi:hypothetical protein
MAIGTSKSLLSVGSGQPAVRSFIHAWIDKHGCIMKEPPPYEWEAQSLGSSLAHLDEDEDHVQADALQDVWQDLQHGTRAVSQAAVLLHEAA